MNKYNLLYNFSLDHSNQISRVIKDIVYTAKCVCSRTRSDNYSPCQLPIAKSCIELHTHIKYYSYIHLHVCSLLKIWIILSCSTLRSTDGRKLYEVTIVFDLVFQMTSKVSNIIRKVRKAFDLHCNSILKASFYRTCFFLSVS